MKQLSESILESEGLWQVCRCSMEFANLASHNLGVMWECSKVRDGEMTIKKNIRFLKGGGLGGREENRPKL